MLWRGIVRKENTTIIEGFIQQENGKQNSSHRDQLLTPGSLICARGNTQLSPLPQSLATKQNQSNPSQVYGISEKGKRGEMK